jgi:hypothetical protein
VCYIGRVNRYDQMEERALALGERNADAIELVRKHCANARVEHDPMGGISMLEQMTGLPISGRTIKCQYAPKGAGFSTIELLNVAVSFYNNNCVGCPHRIPVGIPNLKTVAEQITKDEEEAVRRREREAELRREEQSARHLERERRVVTEPVPARDKPHRCRGWRYRQTRPPRQSGCHAITWTSTFRPSCAGFVAADASSSQSLSSSSGWSGWRRGHWSVEGVAVSATCMRRKSPANRLLRARPGPAVRRPDPKLARRANTHGARCQCTRCTGFQPGHDLSTKHGAYAEIKLGPRVNELAVDLRVLIPAYSPSDEPALRLLAMTLARLERAETALEAAEPEDLGRLRQDALGWANAARRLLNDLGMTPTARARLGLDLTRAKGEALRAHLEQAYVDGEPL